MASTLRFAGQVSIGGSVSRTVTAKLHVAVLLVASRAVQVTVVRPTLKRDPEAGAQVTATGPSQLSLAVGAGQITTAVHAPASAATERSFEHPVICGGSRSTTVTTNRQKPLLPAPSTALQLTSADPLLKRVTAAHLSFEKQPPPAAAK